MLTLLELIEETCDSNNSLVLRHLLCSKALAPETVMQLVHKPGQSNMILSELLNFIALTAPQFLIPQTMEQTDLILRYLRGQLLPPNDLD
jgi:hypothetical protein